ncbi:hypothetical protein PUR34_31030 [Streptomyces sp. JV185]|uniref:hypothetical protein n=1 Tax=Streptomyces sp. JV185 TaxID=858638 RepID=UPI002E7649FE|nr:hypothetical protein [Streptomyces sp. JV185]MEE1772477.1 hypothetical protein [Streptomyces sp. JV185]
MSWRVCAGLVALAVLLVPAFVIAPRPLAASISGGGFDDRGELVDSFSESFVAYWRSGERNFSPDLERIADYWSHYHAVKAVIAALLLIVFIALGVLLWKAFLQAGGLGAGSRAALASAGAVVTALALFALAAVMANVQGATAPFSSLLPMLPIHASHGELADTLHQVGQGLADYPDGTGDRTPSALEAMVGDFARYHAVIAVAGTVVAVVLAGMCVASWRRSARTGVSDGRTRRVFRSFGIVSGLLSAAVVVVAVANTATTADPAPALLAFFEGGW